MASDSGRCSRSRVSCLPPGPYVCESRIGTMHVDHEIAAAVTLVHYGHTEFGHGTKPVI
jgi:hypothetical protein